MSPHYTKRLSQDGGPQLWTARALTARLLDSPTIPGPHSPWMVMAHEPVHSLPVFFFPSNPVRSVSNLLNLVANGVLPQAAWPPKDIIRKTPLEYLDWISHLPRNLQNEIIHLTLPCSLLMEKKKVCLSGGPDLAPSQQTTVLIIMTQPPYIHEPQLYCGSHQTTQKMNITWVTQPRKANFQHFDLKLPCWVSYFHKRHY